MLCLPKMSTSRFEFPAALQPGRILTLLLHPTGWRRPRRRSKAIPMAMRTSTPRILSSRGQCQDALLQPRFRRIPPWSQIGKVSIPIHLGSLATSKAVAPGPEGRQTIAQRVSSGFRPPLNSQPRQERQNPFPHKHRIRPHRSTTPRNTKRIRGIHAGDISRRGTEPLRATGNRERGHA